MRRLHARLQWVARGRRAGGVFVTSRDGFVDVHVVRAKAVQAIAYTVFGSLNPIGYYSGTGCVEVIDLVRRM